jgi:CMP-N-acetylneuraminic acid synthetase/GT2 family glycosyltransferase
MVKVTVYITSYNYAKYVEQAVESVLSQTYKDFELLIFDDGSTDNTQQVLEKYKSHPKVQVIHQDNMGMPKTCNKALAMAKGEYIMRLDADDYLDENLLLVFNNILDMHPEISMVFSDYYEVDGDGYLNGVVRRKKIGEESKLLDLPAHGACTMIRKESLEKLGGYSEDIKCQDGYDLWIRFIQKFKAYNVNTPLFYYRKHDQSSTTNSKKILEARKQIKNKFVQKNGIKKKTLLIIPVRRKSKIYDDLPLRKINDKHIMEYVMHEAVKTGVDKVVVTTEDEEVASIVREKVPGASVIMRPKELSEFNTPIEPTMHFVLKELEEKESFIPDIVGIIFYTSPLIKSKHIQEAINTLIIYDADSVVGVRENPRLHYTHGEYGLNPIFKKRAIKPEREYLYEESGSFILSKRESITPESLVGKKISHVILTDDESIDIEDRFTYWMAEQVLKNLDEVENLDVKKITRGY